ncbi:MAG: hypothetical protein RLZZ22_281 [Pseudomonadota bacterium]|jgi:negative regulator of sigma E activity
MNPPQNLDAMPTPFADGRESLSALVDGECSPDELAALLRHGPPRQALDAAWTSYQAVGAALRQSAGDDARPPSTDFAAAVMARLAAEAPPGVARVTEMPPRVRARAAANDEGWSWKWVAGLAACAAAAAFGWQLLEQEVAAGPELARSQPATR